MNSEDTLLLAALRSLSAGECVRRPIRLQRLSRQARETLNDLVAGLEIRLRLLGICTLSVRADLFGLLQIDPAPDPAAGRNNLHGPDPAATA